MINQLNLVFFEPLILKSQVSEFKSCVLLFSTCALCKFLLLFWSVCQRNHEENAEKQHMSWHGYWGNNYKHLDGSKGKGTFVEGAGPVSWELFWLIAEHQLWYIDRFLISCFNHCFVKTAIFGLLAKWDILRFSSIFSCQWWQTKSKN